MIKVNRLKVSIKVAVAMMAIVAFACTRDRIVENPNVGHDPNNGNNSNTDVVTFGFNFENTWTPDVIGNGQQDPYDAKKAAVTILRPQATPMECDNDGAIDNIYMYMVEENIPAIAKYGDGTRTEGDSNNGEGVTTDNGYGNIGMIAFHSIDGEESSSTTKVFMNNINLAEYDDKTYWPAKGGNIDFYAYYPYYNAETAPSYYSVQYSLTDNGYRAPEINYEVPSTVDDQYDLMRGYVQTGDYSNSSVEIDMSHLLSQIQVNLGDIDQGEITSIAINNVYYKGTNSYVEVTDPEDGTVKLMPKWIVEDEDEDDKINYEITEGNGIVKSDDHIEIKPMYLMPQDLPDNAEIEVTIQVSEGVEYCLKKNLKEITTTWLPNKKYTYTISTPHEIEVEVTDVVEQVEGGAPQKKDLVIANVGMATAYIRLDLVGAWCVDKENIINGETKTETLVVGEWKPAEDGTFVWGAGGEPISDAASVRNWRKGADGYYYYMLPLRRGEQIKDANAFFESYTLTSRGPMNNAYLELTIMVQAVFTDDAEMIWDSAIWNVIKNNQ